MTDNRSDHQKKVKRIKFSFHAPQAERVQILGDFNQWDNQKSLLKQCSKGIWEKTLMLKPGTYEYKFIVDGIWKEDPANPDNRPNPFGTTNNLITVPE